MCTETYDIVVVVGGTAGAFAAAAAAGKGCDVALLERKSGSEAGHIACGDALKAAEGFPDTVDTNYLREEAVSNGGLQRAVFLNPAGEDYEYQFREDGTIIDRKRFGEVLLEEADRAGAELHYNTVVRDARQNGRVRGVDAVREGDPVRYESDIVIDAAGSLSLLQDQVDFGGTHYDTNVQFSQFCSAYREVIETPDPVEYDDALVDSRERGTGVPDERAIDTAGRGAQA